MFKENEYPQCFIIRENTTEEAAWFVVIESEDDNPHLSRYQEEYLKSKYTVEFTSLAEAETYSAFGLAPLGTCEEFYKWVDDTIHAEVMEVGNLATGTKYLGADTYPSYYVVLPKNNNTKAICVYPIKSKEQNIEMPISWWEELNKTMFVAEVEYGAFERHIAMDRVFEYNTKELLERVESVTKKGA